MTCGRCPHDCGHTDIQEVVPQPPWNPGPGYTLMQCTCGCQAWFPKEQP